MQIKNVRSFTLYEIETVDGIFYRTNFNGSMWERLYGESWEPVYMTEEEECLKAWRKVTGLSNDDDCTGL